MTFSEEIVSAVCPRKTHHHNDRVLLVCFCQCGVVLWL